MKRTILTFALVAAGLLTAAGAAHAQYPIQSYSFNPWGPNPGVGVTTYSPYVGLGTRNYTYNPWTGTQFYNSTFANPRTGFSRSYSSGYNPWFNQYQYQYQYNNGFNNGFPRTTWGYSPYWR